MYFSQAQFSLDISFLLLDLLLEFGGVNDQCVPGVSMDLVVACQALSTQPHCNCTLSGLISYTVEHAMKIKVITQKSLPFRKVSSNMMH